MTAKQQAQFRKVTVRLWAQDVEYLRERHPDNYNAVIRRVIGDWIIRQKRQRKHAQEN